MILAKRMAHVWLTVGILLLSGLTVSAKTPFVNAQFGQATLTGAIYDRAVDTDANGMYDYLEVAVEINVTEAGNFRVEVNSFMNESAHYLNAYDDEDDFLETGLWNMTLFFYGPIFHNARFDLKSISQVSLFREYEWLETLYDVSLSRIYYYTEFDIAAFLANEVTDNGVDMDGNGLFDVLQVEVEINVSEPGEYYVSVWSLMDKTDPYYTRYYYEGQMVYENLPGVHTLVFNFSGPGLATTHINATAVESISLYVFDTEFKYNLLDQLYDIPLSMTYNYAMFDAPSKDAELNFTVNPDGSLRVGMLANFTHMYPPNLGPLVNSTLSTSRSGNLTMGAANCVFSIPGDMGDIYNSLDGQMQAVIKNGMLNSTISGTLVLPSQAQAYYPYNSTDLVLEAAYANGLLNAHVSGETVVPMFESMFPFNASDLTVFADFNASGLSGNVTFHVVSGFPLADVRTEFEGNWTNIRFTGDINVTYGTFGDLQLNSTVLDEMISDMTGQIMGQGENSLYNMTSGMLEVTELDTLKTPWTDPEMGADVTYAVTVNGNLTGFLGNLIAEQMLYQYSDTEYSAQIAYAALESLLSSLNEAHLILNYYHLTGTGSIVSLDITCDAKAFWNNALVLVPPALPPEAEVQLTACLRMANATAYGVQDFGLDASFSSSELKIVAAASILVNETQMKTDTLSLIPDLAPPELHDMVESVLNSSYASLELMTATCEMTNGTGNFSMEWTMQGDMSTELNRGIRLYFDVLNVTSPGVGLPPEFSLLNETDIDINNLQAQIDLGRDTLFINLTGLVVQPTVDYEDLVRFRLQHWFERLGDVYESLQGTQKLKVNVVSGFDSEHIILLDPSSLPSDPDSYSLNCTSLTWQNTTFSNMGALQYLIAYDGKISYAATTYHVPIFTNSDVTNVTFLSAINTIRLEVSGQNGTGFCNVTIPRNFIYAALGEWRVKFDGVYLTQGSFNVSENAEYVFLYLNYTHSTHTIEIEGTWAIAELQPNFLPIILAVIALVVTAAIIRNRRRAAPTRPCVI